ncbi:uncharacterized protein A4U43_C04F22190, partial [Asparagus officinalis]
DRLIRGWLRGGRAFWLTIHCAWMSQLPRTLKTVSRMSYRADHSNSNSVGSVAKESFNVFYSSHLKKFDVTTEIDEGLSILFCNSFM